MRHWRKSAYLILFIFLCPTVLLCAGQNPAEKKPDKSDKAEKTDKDAPPEIAIPLHQPVKGLHLPFYDLLGKIKMQFDAETANRTSDNVVEMTTLKIETYDDTGQSEMFVQFPRGNYDLSTGVMSTKESIVVRRKDFVLTGVGMEFDTKKKTGRVLSKIRMEVFNQHPNNPPAKPAPNGP